MRKANRPVLMLAAVLLALVAASAVYAEWLKGSVHNHSWDSDGAKKLEGIWQKGHEADLDFIVVTPHTDCFGEGVNHYINDIFHPFERLYPHLHLENNYYDDVVVECERLSKLGRPLMITGAEFSLTHQRELRHVLVIGLDEKTRPPYETEGFPRLFWYPVFKPMDEAEFFQMIVKREKEVGHAIPTIIAHSSYWEPPANLDAIAKVTPHGRPLGVEIFNDTMSIKGEEKDLELACQWEKSGQSVFFTAGADSHLTYDFATKLTYVEASELTMPAIVEAFNQGKTYASKYGGVGKVSLRQEIAGLWLYKGQIVFDHHIKKTMPAYIYVDGYVGIIRDDVGKYDDYLSLEPIPDMDQTVYRFEYWFRQAGSKPRFFFYMPGQLVVSPGLVKFGSSTQSPIEKGHGRISITAKPDNAKVSLSGFKLGGLLIEGPLPLQRDLPVGKYSLTIYASYYANYQEEIQIEEGKTKDINVHLRYTGEDIFEGSP